MFGKKHVKLTQQEYDDLLADIEGLKKLAEKQEHAITRLTAELAKNAEDIADQGLAVRGLRQLYESGAEQWERRLAALESPKAAPVFQDYIAKADPPVGA